MCEFYLISSIRYSHENYYEESTIYFKGKRNRNYITFCLTFGTFDAPLFLFFIYSYDVHICVLENRGN